MTQPLNSNLDDQSSSEYASSSEEDNKKAAAYWYIGTEYEHLPPHVKKAMFQAKLNSKHSEFYYKLKDLNSKIGLYKNLFYNKIPWY